MPKVNAVLKKVKKIELNTNQIVEGLISGNYKSVFKGRGIEFSEVREYVPGDDIRAIDWNVTARLNCPYVKEFIEERDLDVYIVFDVSSSNDFGSSKSKKELGYEIAASIMLAALKNNDNIGLALFSKNVEKLIRPRKGKKHFLRILRELVYYTPKHKGTDINNSLMYLSRIVKKKGIIFVISDFICEKNFDIPLRYLRRKNDILLVKIIDSNESDIPDVGYIFVEDEETGEQMMIDTSDPEFRISYRENIDEESSKLKEKMKRLKIDIIEVKTDERFEDQFRRFFRLKTRRMIR